MANVSNDESSEAGAPNHRATSNRAPRRSTHDAQAAEPLFGRLPGFMQTLGSGAVVLLAAGTVVYWGFQLAVVLRVAVLPVMLGIVVSALLAPGAAALQRLRVPRAVAAPLSVLLGSCLLWGAVALAGYMVAQEGSNFGTAMEDGYRELVGWSAQTTGISQGEMSAWVDQHLEELRSEATSAAGAVASGLANVATTATILVLTGVFAWFFLWDGERQFHYATGLLAERERKHAEALGSRAWQAIGSYMRGMLLIATADAVLLGIGLLLVGVPLVVPLMLLMFVGAFIPYVGALLAGLSTVLIALAEGGLTMAAFALLVVFIVQQLEGNVLSPFVMSRTVNLAPAVVLFSVTAGGALAGVVGVFLAVPITACMAAALSYARDVNSGAESR